MSRAHAALLIMLVAGCGAQREYAAPAPAGALQCALEQAEELGYERMSGEAEEEYVRVSQRVDPPPALELTERPPPPGPEAIRPVYEERPMSNQLLLRHDGDMLRIEILHSLEADDPEEEPTRGAEAHAQMILTTCSG